MPDGMAHASLRLLDANGSAINNFRVDKFGSRAYYPGSEAARFCVFAKHLLITQKTATVNHV